MRSEKRQAGQSNFILIIICNSILMTPFPMLIILGGLAGLLLAPAKEFATLPVSFQMLAGMVSAAPMSLFMGRFGRKYGFLLGGLMASTGGMLGCIAIFQQNFWLLCFGQGLLGAAVICFGYFRFAAAEIVSEKFRPTAISITLGSGLVAALVAPEIFTVSKDYFAPIPFAGAYMAIAMIGLLGCIPVLFLTLPKKITDSRSANAPKIRIAKVITRKPVFVAILCASLAYGIMMLLMTSTPIAMVGCGFLDTQAGDVIRWHVIAMFGPSFFTGYLISRFGSLNIIITGFMMLSVSAATAISGVLLENFYLSLILLGLGWNFGFVGATSLLTESLSEEERPLIQGVNDTLVALAASVASFSSGAAMAMAGWAVVASIAFPMVVVAIGCAFVIKSQRASY